MDTLEESHACRICGNDSDDTTNIFDEKRDYAKKIDALLPIMVHKLDFLSKVICNTCSCKLDEFYDFYLKSLRTDKLSKSQLSWMNKREKKEVRNDRPMVRIHNVNIKIEPVEYEGYGLNPVIRNFEYVNSMKSDTFSMGDRSRTCRIPDRIAYQTRSQHSCNKQNHKKRFISNEYNQYSSCEEYANSSITDVNNLSDNLSENSRVNFCSNDKNNFFQENNKIMDQDQHKKSIILRKRRLGELSGNPLNYALRPRKVFVNYVETRQKLPSFLKINNCAKSNDNVHRTVSLADQKINIISATVKIEKEEKQEQVVTEHFERRALRPRKVPINYSDNKRKTYDVLKFPLSNDINIITAKKPKLVSLTDKWTRLSNNKSTERIKSPSKKMKFDVKKEMHDDLENHYVMKS
ncbi:PREDICTED: uncharacterized protein LOC107064266 [Polistes dominula]|uniref:Uncharacterized protein LOC107064266 n=1 Tax=Polistes dominula TaxID=743375 RepID=A0ABM1HW59_POLDO|nr:PREDICTED: uncharacterized protein LOC107064266 [Polistes dominula]XP_015172197.1 PREDICTED: uncharacterized protein LOC107064266 [Polistes dominula]